ncbi:MAG: glycosyltransferase, partial [Lachnospiraceae bacterium]|nr:glycosyltransferase [Lachnospiraceae bacterium]
TDYICYNGITPDGPAEIRQHDAVVDFSLNHSFGMPYIEGIMNGKMVFCQKNQGSKEVMEKIPEAYIRSYEDLTKKILSLPEIPAEKLQEYYDIISEKYSRDTLAKNMIAYLNEE